MPVMFSPVFYPDVSIFDPLNNKRSCVGKCFHTTPCKERISHSVYAYSKEYSQNFMNCSISLFRLPTNFLGKHLQYKTCKICS